MRVGLSGVLYGIVDRVDCKIRQIEFLLEISRNSTCIGVCPWERRAPQCVIDAVAECVKPDLPLKFIDKLKKDFAADPRIFSRLIREKILDNTHCLTLVVKPDREIQQKKDAAFTEKMRAMKQALNAEQLTAIARNQEELDELANEPNSPDLASRTTTVARPLIEQTKTPSISTCPLRCSKIVSYKLLGLKRKV